jgi:predicted RecB family nuclease
MEIGRTFSIEDKNYVIKKITGDRVDASRIVGTGADAKIQRGRPCKFSYKQVADALGESVPETSQEPVENETAMDEWRATRSDPEKLRAVISSLGEDANITTDEW